MDDLPKIPTANTVNPASQTQELMLKRSNLLQFRQPGKAASPGFGPGSPTPASFVFNGGATACQIRAYKFREGSDFDSDQGPMCLLLFIFKGAGEEDGSAVKNTG